MAGALLQDQPEIERPVQLRSLKAAFRALSRPWLKSQTVQPLSALPWIVLSFGLILTGLVCENQRHAAQLEHDRATRLLSGEVNDAIKDRLRTNQALLDAVVGLFQASTSVTRDEFRRFYDSLNLRDSNLDGIQGVGYAAVVPGNNVAAFEQRIRSEGQPDFRVKPSGQRALTTAIVYLQPNDWRNQRAKGYDMYSQETRRAAMAEAATTGESTVSGPVRLLQETNTKPQVGLLLYTPIYQNGKTSFDSSEARLRSLQGWAYSPLRMGDLINSALRDIHNPLLLGSQIAIYDGSQIDPKALMFSTEGLREPSSLVSAVWSDLTFANRSWLIGVAINDSRLSRDGWSWAVVMTLFLGGSVAMTSALVTRLLVNAHVSVRDALVKETKAAEEQALATTVFETVSVAIVVTDTNGIILRSNPAFTQLSGYSAIEVSGQKTNLLRSGRHDDSFYREMWQSIIEKGHWSGEVWNRHASGQIRRHELSITAVRDRNNQPLNYLALWRDITDRYDHEERMRHLATHDQLTGLPNRTLLMDRLKTALALAKRQGQRVGLFFIDLDGFKPVNDRFGHAVGDQLLRSVADRLRSRLRESDMLCRHGGDEFVLLVPEVPALEQLLQVALKMQGWVSEPYPDLPEGVALSCSIGLAIWPDHASSAEDLLVVADKTMYRAKGQGGARIEVASSLVTP